MCNKTLYYSNQYIMNIITVTLNNDLLYGYQKVDIWLNLIPQIQQQILSQYQVV